MDLIARGHAGTIRVSLLGAARTLLGYEPRLVADVASMPVPTVNLDSPHGTLTAVPPPLTLDGGTIALPVGRYGGAGPVRWSPGAPSA